MIRDDHITITETILIKRTISVTIEIHNYKEIVQQNQGKVIGTLTYWLCSKRVEDAIKTKVMEQIEGKLKAPIEERINAEFSSRVCEDVTKEISAQLAAKKIKATVRTSVN